MTNLKLIFKDQKLLDQALTHRSWVNEHKGLRKSNERLEFLGDAVLEFIISNKLYQMFPNKEEGYLTALRSTLVNTLNLSTLARKLNLGQAVFLSRGEEDSGGRENQSLLADTFEAIVGALYLDGGTKKAEKFLKTNLYPMIAEKIKQPLKDAKSRLQEEIQAQDLPAPKYSVIKESGPDHAKSFAVEVLINREAFTKGEGKSKAEAEQAAAEEALKKLHK